MTLTSKHKMHKIINIPAALESTKVVTGRELIVASNVRCMPGSKIARKYNGAEEYGGSNPNCEPLITALCGVLGYQSGDPSPGCGFFPILQFFHHPSLKLPEIKV